MFYHPLPQKIFIYVATLMFVVLAVGGLGLTAYFFLLYLGKIESNLHSNLFLVIIIFISWLYTIRCSYISFVFLKTINVRLVYNSDGVSIESSGQKAFFQWSELTNYKEYSDMDILSLVDSNKKPIIMLWKYAPSFNKFVQEWSAKSGI